MPDTSKREKKKIRRKKTRLQMILFLTLIFFIFIISTTLWKFFNTYDSVYQPDIETASTNQPFTMGSASAAEKDKLKPTAILLLGKDSRPATGSLNTDVIMVAVANPNTQQVFLLSIPRDTRIEIPGYTGNYKANAVYAYGEMHRREAVNQNRPVTETGISLAKETFGHYLGIPIEHYVTVDFKGFTAVIDQLGGIEVDVDRTLIYDDPSDNTHIYLNEGKQNLTGEEALGYVRHRLDNRGPQYYSSDFDRNRRQRQVITSVLNKAVSLEGLTNIFDLLTIAGDHIKTDVQLSKMKDFLINFSGINADSIVPIDNEAYWESSIGFTIIPEQRLTEIRSLLKTVMEMEK